MLHLKAWGSEPQRLAAYYGSVREYGELSPLDKNHVTPLSGTYFSTSISQLCIKFNWSICNWDPAVTVFYHTYKHVVIFIKDL
jgi:hypothetical protein